MYTIVQKRTNIDLTKFDYVLKDFDILYTIADSVTVSFHGNYKIAILTDDVKAIQEFLKVEQRYIHVLITIVTSDEVIDYVTAYNPGAHVEERTKLYDQYIEMLRERRIFMDSKVQRLLYSSIEHTMDAIDTVLEQIVVAYGSQVLITEEMLSKIVVLEEITYPRTVLLEYLQVKRWRRAKLQNALRDVGNDILLGAMIKNVKVLLTEKITFLKTGQGTFWAKEIPTKNLILMYRVLVLERGGVNDVELLLNLYEDGLSVKDVLSL